MYIIIQYRNDTLLVCKYTYTVNFELININMNPKFFFWLHLCRTIYTTSSIHHFNIATPQSSRELLMKMTNKLAN